MIIDWRRRFDHLGATASVYIGQPLDTIKTKLQTFPNRYKNFLDCAQKIFYKDGIHGLYAGTVPALMANAAGKSTFESRRSNFPFDCREWSAVHGVRAMSTVILYTQ